MDVNYKPFSRFLFTLFREVWFEKFSSTRVHQTFFWSRQNSLESMMKMLVAMKRVYFNFSAWCNGWNIIDCSSIWMMVLILCTWVVFFVLVIWCAMHDWLKEIFHAREIFLCKRTLILMIIKTMTMKRRKRGNNNSEDREKKKKHEKLSFSSSVHSASFRIA